MKTKKEKKSTRELLSSFSVIKPYLFEHKSKLILFSLVSICSAALAPLQNYIFSILVEGITKNSVVVLGYTLTVSFLAVIWGIVLALNSFIDWRRINANSIFIEKILRLFVLDFSRHLVRLPLSFHKKRNISDVTEKMSQSRSDLYELMSTCINDFGPAMLTMFVALVIVWQYSLVIFGVIFLLILVYISFLFFTAPKTLALVRESRAGYRKASSTFYEAVQHYRSIKDFQTEEFEYKRAKDQYFSYVIPTWIKYFNFSQRTGFIQRGILISARIIIFFLSISFYQNGDFTLASIIFVNSLVGLIFTPLQDVARVYRHSQNTLSSLSDIKEILLVPEEIYETENFIKDLQISGNLEFKNLGFSYDEGQLILSDISFSVKAGEVVALVGESGVGKSTLVNLISGYYFPTQGDLLIENRPIRSVSLLNLRKAISIVPQEPALFNDTIKYNLAYGSSVTDEKLLEEAARKAHCLEFIEKMPHKWETLVGDRGVRLSVGQKQRIAIARAILRDPKILILDEPTSALDAGSEKIVVTALEELMTGRTTFIIAHRLSTVRKANKIVVFKDGKIVEIGTHEELLKNTTGEYRRLHDLQIGIHE